MNDALHATIEYCSLLSSEEKYESPYVVYLREGHIDYHDILLFRMLQLSERSIRQYRKHNLPFMRSSGPCLQNSLHDNVAVDNGRGIEFATQRREIQA